MGADRGVAHSTRRSVLLLAALALAACGGEPPAGRDGSIPDTAGDATIDGAGGSVPSAPDTTAAELPRLEGEATLESIDEAARDESLVRFRDELLRAVERRDTAFLYSIVADEIRNSFGDNNGVAAFRDMWHPERADSELWPVLGRLLRLGGTLRDAGASGVTFTAPYVFAAWPGEFDAFQHVATVSDDAVLRERPEADAPALGALPYQVVSVARWDQPASARGWVQVALPDGTRGWLRSSDVYSPVGWRAIFQKRDGRWVMTVLIAGD